MRKYLFITMCAFLSLWAGKVSAQRYLPGQTGLLYPEVLRRAVREGHEIANHMWDHHIPRRLRRRPSTWTGRIRSSRG